MFIRCNTADQIQFGAAESCAAIVGDEHDRGCAEFERCESSWNSDVRVEGVLLARQGEANWLRESAGALVADDWVTDVGYVFVAEAAQRRVARSADEALGGVFGVFRTDVSEADVDV